MRTISGLRKLGCRFRLARLDEDTPKYAKVRYIPEVIVPYRISFAPPARFHTSYPNTKKSRSTTCPDTFPHLLIPKGNRNLCSGAKADWLTFRMGV
jgi:hypothetical protein